MMGWLAAWGIAALFGAGGFFALSLFLAVYFPRLTQLLFAILVWPVYTAFFGTWAFIIGWIFSWIDFSWASYKSTLFWTSIPVGLTSLYLARAVRELGADRKGFH